MRGGPSVPRSGTSGILARTTTSVLARTLTQGAGITITNPDGVDGNPTFAMRGGSNTDRSAANGYTCDIYPGSGGAVADNTTLTQLGTKTLAKDASGRRSIGFTGTPNYIYTTLGMTLPGAIPSVLTFVFKTNAAALTGNVYKVGLVGATSLTSALADVLQSVLLVYRNASDPGYFYFITGTAATTTTTLTAIPVAANTTYKAVLTYTATSATWVVYSLSGSTWVQIGTHTQTTTLPGAGSALAAAIYTAATTGTNGFALYGANFFEDSGW